MRHTRDAWLNSLIEKETGKIEGYTGIYDIEYNPSIIDSVSDRPTASTIVIIKGNNYVKNYAGEGALVGDNSVAHFVVDSTRIDLGQPESEMRLFIGFKYTLAGEEFTAGVNGGKDLTYLSFTPNASDTIEGIYSEGVYP